MDNMSAFTKISSKKLFLTPLVPEWIQILKSNVSIYSLLPKNLKDELHEINAVFRGLQAFLYIQTLMSQRKLNTTD
jgi:hypothetical protein